MRTYSDILKLVHAHFCNYANLLWFSVGHKCSVYGWGPTKKGGPHRFTVQQVHIKKQTCCQYWHGFGPYGFKGFDIEAIKTYNFICAGVFGYTLCPVRII